MWRRGIKRGEVNAGLNSIKDWCVDLCMGGQVEVNYYWYFPIDWTVHDGRRRFVDYLLRVETLQDDSNETANKMNARLSCR